MYSITVYNIVRRHQVNNTVVRDSHFHFYFSPNHATHATLIYFISHFSLLFLYLSMTSWPPQYHDPPGLLTIPSWLIHDYVSLPWPFGLHHIRHPALLRLMRLFPFPSHCFSYDDVAPFTLLHIRCAATHPSPSQFIRLLSSSSSALTRRLCQHLHVPFVITYASLSAWIYK